SFAPNRSEIRRIDKQGGGHQELRAKIVVELCRTGRHDDVKQALFEKWLRIGLLSFGRPGTPGKRYAIEHGIKKRDSGECMKDFVEDIRPSVDAAGLRFPDAAALTMELPEELLADR